ncbi:MAG: DUF1501 domain-containing protein [Pirellulales bacterium]|nr:DUF1501 domain-containing protein [Pirellulales bacterium]
MNTSTRREFLAGGARGSAVIALGATAPALLCQAAETAQHDQRFLLVVELAGGNDGLNSVIPHADADYPKARPKLAVAAADTLAINSEIGLHPSLRGFADLLEEGKFAAVQGVGYDNPNRSHFESMDIWHTCQRKDESRRDGWLGRYLEGAAVATGKDPAAMHLGAEKQPLALMSRDLRVPSIESLKQFRLRGVDRPQFKAAIRELAATDRRDANDLLSFVQTSTSSAIQTSERMESASLNYTPSQPYPQTGLGRKLETVAKLVASGLSTKVYYVRLDGFDTHANQAAAHAALLREVGDALNVLMSDLDAHGHGDRVLAMCFSEFGRRVAENASEGTDHGTAGPIFLAGTKVRAGLIGRHPSLTDLDQGDLKYHTDFRQVYAAILEDWLQCPSESALLDRFKKVDLFT